MAPKPTKHRASALARRQALLEAAIQVVSERGLAGATHRAICAQAGLPPSTTTYFFSSIEELLIEALTHFTRRRVEQFSQLSSELAGTSTSQAEIAYGFAQALCTFSPHEIAQFELYLDAGRPSSLLQDGVASIIDGFKEVTVAALRAAGVPEPERLAPVVVCLADGFALHGIARGHKDLDPAPLAEAFLLLVQSAASWPEAISSQTTTGSD